MSYIFQFHSLLKCNYTQYRDLCLLNESNKSESFERVDHTQTKFFKSYSNIISFKTEHQGTWSTLL